LHETIIEIDADIYKHPKMILPSFLGKPNPVYISLMIYSVVLCSFLMLCIYLNLALNYVTVLYMEKK